MFGSFDLNAKRMDNITNFTVNTSGNFSNFRQFYLLFYTYAKTSGIYLNKCEIQMRF